MENRSVRRELLSRSRHLSYRRGLYGRVRSEPVNLSAAFVQKDAGEANGADAEFGIEQNKTAAERSGAIKGPRSAAVRVISIRTKRSIWAVNFKNLPGY
jgi:hypothetical protein